MLENRIPDFHTFILNVDIIRINENAFFIIKWGGITAKLVGFTGDADKEDILLYEESWEYYKDFMDAYEEEGKRYLPPPTNYGKEIPL